MTKTKVRPSETEAPPVVVWRLIAHHAEVDKALRWFVSSKLIAVGWGRIGDLSQMSLESPNDIAKLVSSSYPEMENSGSGGTSLWRFLNVMKKGDLVILGPKRRLVMRIDGDYEYSNVRSPISPGDYRHQRRATRVAQDPEMLWLRCGAKIAPGEGMRWTVARCGDLAVS
ncbi:MAG TPA: hypothetical protein VF720_03700 [Candidatus Eisenbacteria bacterium]